METPAAIPTTGMGQDDSNTGTAVAFLGPINSYSHQATRLAFPDERRYQLEPTGTIKEVFDRVQSGHAAYGVVPFENSTHGTVTFTLDALADRAAEYAAISVCDEVYLDVHHFLLGRLPPSPGPASPPPPPPPPPPLPSPSSSSDLRGVPLCSLDHVVRVYSHPQAHGQTAAFYKSLVSFTVPHRRPGALADVLGCFRGRGLNLTSISSVPSLVGPFQYLFFVEFEGSRFDDPEGRVSGAFGDLERVAERWRWLGSWRDRRGAR
ncbi:PDT-domain-containing protein [Trichocladium antarcticum]|uniref:PDT-domain-containing protein n=1 Tax=Trichocladium antarcticum TaxID=1450529 RepID=A0AAN6UMS0_9PEZI|nr:PDT-domain-containing protein [Trichocladium antarcticum]